MGQWHISIQGEGVHHNVSTDVPEDADKLTAQFVKDLLAAGHKLSYASFTSGSRLELPRTAKESKA